MGATASPDNASGTDGDLVSQALTGLVRLLARQAAAELLHDCANEALPFAVDDPAVQGAAE